MRGAARYAGSSGKEVAIMMWFAGLDIQSRSTRLALVTLDRKGIPLVVERRGWRRRPDAGQILAQLVTWEARYELRLGAVVLGGHAPGEYVRALRQQQYRLEWVQLDELEDVARAWRALRLEARWRRGEWLCSLAMGRLCSNPIFATWTSWDWVYASVSRQVQSLGSFLEREGYATPVVSGATDDLPDIGRNLQAALQP